MLEKVYFKLDVVRGKFWLCIKNVIFFSIYVFCMGYCIFLAVDFVCWFFSGLYYVVVFINKVDVYKLEV